MSPCSPRDESVSVSLKTTTTKRMSLVTVAAAGVVGRRRWRCRCCGGQGTAADAAAFRSAEYLSFPCAISCVNDGGELVSYSRPGFFLPLLHLTHSPPSLRWLPQPPSFPFRAFLSILRPLRPHPPSFLSIPVASLLKHPRYFPLIHTFSISLHYSITILPNIDLFYQFFYFSVNSVEKLRTKTIPSIG